MMAALTSQASPVSSLVTEVVLVAAPVYDEWSGCGVGFLHYCRLRVSQWVNDSFKGHKGHEEEPDEQEGGAHVVVAVHKAGSHASKGKHSKEGFEEEQDAVPGRRPSDGGSVAEGSQSGDDAMSAITSSAGGEEGEELSADFRWGLAGIAHTCRAACRTQDGLASVHPKVCTNKRSIS